MTPPVAPRVIEKAAVTSKGFWGSLLAFVPVVLEVGQQVANSLPPSPSTTSVVAAIGGVLMLISKLQKVQSQVTGILTPAKDK